MAARTVGVAGLVLPNPTVRGVPLTGSRGGLGRPPILFRWAGEGIDDRRLDRPDGAQRTRPPDVAPSALGGRRCAARLLGAGPVGDADSRTLGPVAPFRDRSPCRGAFGCRFVGLAVGPLGDSVDSSHTARNGRVLPGASAVRRGLDEPSAGRGAVPGAPARRSPTGVDRRSRPKVGRGGARGGRRRGIRASTKRPRGGLRKPTLVDGDFSHPHPDRPRAERFRRGRRCPRVR